MTPVTEAVPALKIAERLDRIEVSATMAVVAEAEKLRQSGVDVVDLSLGEPHFATPLHVKDAAIAAINGNVTLCSRRSIPVGLPVVDAASV